MSSTILPLILLILAIITQCFMVPLQDDFELPLILSNIEDIEDDYENMFEAKNIYNHNEEPKFIFTPNGIFFKSQYDFNKIDDLVEPEVTTASTMHNAEPNVEEMNPELRNELYLAELNKTITIIHKIAEIVHSVNVDELNNIHDNDAKKDEITCLIEKLEKQKSHMMSIFN